MLGPAVHRGKDTTRKTLECVCVMRVRGPNNVRRAVETDTTCDIMGVVSQQCYVRLHGALIYWSHLRLPTTD